MNKINFYNYGGDMRPKEKTYYFKRRNIDEKSNVRRTWEEWNDDSGSYGVVNVSYDLPDDIIKELIRHGDTCEPKDAGNKQEQYGIYFDA